MLSHCHYWHIVNMSKLPQYCRLMYSLVSFLLSYSTAIFSERYQALAGCQNTDPVIHVSDKCESSLCTQLAAAASNERKTHESISSLKHHFVVFVRRPSSILKNAAEKFMWNFIFRKYSCH